MNMAGENSGKSSLGDDVDPLKAIEPIGKSRRFRLLLPIIIAKIDRGVEHAEIIKALSRQGLELTQGTYFSYLKRYRPTASRQPQENESAPRQATTKPAGPGAVTTAPGGGSIRPRTFDYDPRGIDPELLK